jgi:peptide deformylase
LRSVARPVGELTTAVKTLVDDLFETMYATKGLGLAAPQVDAALRIVTLDVSGNGSAPELFINPQIVSSSGLGMVEESCLSVPGVVGSVPRALKVHVNSVDRDGRETTRDLEGLLAVCLQHEIDHLDGKLFIDRLPFFTRLRLRRRLGKAVA